MPPPLIVLHGANGSAADMAPLIERLGDQRQVIVPNMLGHGGRPIPERLSISALAQDVLAELDRGGVEAAHWFAYSVGGLVALRIAAHHPKRVLSLATLTTKIVYDEAGVAHAAHLANVERLLRSNPARAEALARMHLPQDWRTLIERVHAMFLTFADAPPAPPALLASITAPLLAFGALQDPLVPADEVRALAGSVPNAVSALFPGTAHPLAMAPLDTIVRTLDAFHADPRQMLRRSKIKLREFRWDR